MSPKADTSASRPYMPPISHTAAPTGAAAGAVANSAAGAGAGITATAQAPRPAAPYSTGASLPPPQALTQNTAVSPAAGSATAGGPTTSLPPITSTYARSPSFTSTQTSAIPGMKNTPGAQSLPHPASSPIHGSTAPASSGAYASGGQPQVQSGARISAPAGGIVSPSARAPSSVQVPLPQQPSSVPPGKQMQSPMVQRTASVQNSPMPPMVQASPRAPVMGTPQGASGAAFSGAPRQPSNATTGNGPSAATARVAPSVSTPTGNAGTVIAQPQPAAAAANPQLSVTTQAAAPAAASAGTGAGDGAHTSAGAATDAANRPLNVRDALSYLDMVKSQFQDRPEVYNQFLDIMKDFKSHTIDTPGVIERVSRLFYGSPALIQGFNTFLPPGYRIDVSDDPNEGVRVTTPSGSVLPDMHRRQPTAQPHSPLSASHSQSHQYAAQRGPSREQYISRQGSASAGGATQQQSQPQANMAAYGGSGGVAAGNGAQAAAAARAPSQVASPSMGPSVHHPRQAPMEFNHAINYVNKIKMRFAAEPDHYKEFLEILQTYQKESRPIQEVYAQVQVLFASAPDLLDEFKQFLPDTSEAGQGAGGALLGGHGSAASPAAGHARSGNTGHQGQQGVAGRAGGDVIASSRLPPVGNFPPTGSVGHAVDPYAQAGGVAGSGAAGGAAAVTGTGRKRRNVMGSGNAQVPGATATKRRNKGSKHESNVLAVPIADAAAAGLYGQAMVDAGMIQMPQNAATATPDELAFFERVKRFIGQPATYNEFLKLLNLYNQEVLDAKALMDRAASFIGDDRELMACFKQFVGYDERQQLVEDSRSGDEAIMESLLGPEPQAYLSPEEAVKTLRPVRQKADLTNCKAYGPSYRLLPASSTQAKCSGRDAMCYEVLNDKWASHPTWASEDTDFMHHKKNCYEDGLFRTEEDRHEMDIEIDTNLSVIRQLTPIAQQIEKMDPEQAMQLTLPENFWGMSEALPRRALRKVYDSHRALEIIKAMHTHPSVAIPIVLKRLKQKDEEWRRQRRECSKAWRESDAKNFYKA
ncbi:Transcriptional regulatory protein sin3, partial [Linderina macrospora]